MTEKSDLLRKLQQKIHYYHITPEGLTAIATPGRLEGDHSARAALNYLKDVGMSPSLNIAEMLHEAYGYDLDETWETLQYLRRKGFITILL